MAFASEIKALFADPDVERQLKPLTLSDIFTCWAPLGELTPYKDIFQLLPGHFARVSGQGMRIQAYWTPDFSDEDHRERPLTDWVDELRDLLLDASRIRLRADVPVGAYLSGGIDSTYVSSLVKRNFNNRLSTFSVSFSDKRFDESAYQSIAVRSLKTDHQDVRCTEDDIGAVFPKIIWHTETPIIRTAPAPISCFPNWCARAISRSFSPVRAPTKFLPATIFSKKTKSAGSGPASRIPQHGPDC